MVAPVTPCGVLHVSGSSCDASQALREAPEAYGVSCEGFGVIQ